MCPLEPSYTISVPEYSNVKGTYKHTHAHTNTHTPKELETTYIIMIDSFKEPLNKCL